ncbi:MAG: hypothetical protein ACREBB_08295 [Nitrosotalea sp.]
MKSIFHFALLCLVLTFFINPAWAAGNTTTQLGVNSLFNPVNIQTNTYSNPTYNFSILPPHGWIPVSQTNQSDTALVVFSNEDPGMEANFAIYYDQGKPIPSSIQTIPQDQILNAAVAKLFDSSKYTIYQKNIEMFSDGFVVQVVASQNQTLSSPGNQTTHSPIVEEFGFWLNDGRQYFLVMVSAQNGFYQNAADFERSAYTFYVGPQPVSGIQIPQWVKNNAKWWSEGSLDDQSFVSGIQYLIKQGIMVIPPTVTNSSNTGQSQQIPSWIKNSAGWWASGQISDTDFVKGIQYLISNNIIKI